LDIKIVVYEGCGRSDQTAMKRSPFYSFKTHILIGEIDYAVEPCKEDYKNTPSRDWLDSSSLFREKEASLLLSQ
jgi:hypothetical protein